MTINREYRDVVDEFIKFVNEFGMMGDKMRCPCKFCKNFYWNTLDEVKYHMISNGMCEDYTVYDLHSEKEVHKIVDIRPKHFHCRKSPKIEPMEMNAMLWDVTGENYEFYIMNIIIVQEASNNISQEIYDIIVQNSVLIYTGNTKYTRINFTLWLL